MKKVFSFDAETNGLWGQAFAISAVVMQEGELVKKFVAYLGDESVTDVWVRENVLPALSGLEKTHSSYESMLADFAKFYLANKDADVITHMGTPVESRILSDMHSMGFIGDWEGPYPLIDVAGILKAKGYDPTSVDKYNSAHSIKTSELDNLVPHHPLYDAIATAIAYQHLLWSYRWSYRPKGRHFDQDDNRPFEMKQHDFYQNGIHHRCTGFDPLHGGRPEYR